MFQCHRQLGNEGGKAQCEDFEPLGKGNSLGLVGQENFRSYGAGVGGRGEEKNDKENR